MLEGPCMRGRGGCHVLEGSVVWGEGRDVLEGDRLSHHDLGPEGAGSLQGRSKRRSR